MDLKNVQSIFKLGAVLSNKTPKEADQLWEDHLPMVTDLFKITSDGSAPVKTPSEMLTEDHNPIHDWGDSIAKIFDRELTKMQRAILKKMKSCENSATLEDLVDAVKTVNPKSLGYAVAGSLAGLSRKCHHYSVPYIYLATDETGEWRYSITDKALPFILKFI